jgi:hypothetical protein
VVVNQVPFYTFYIIGDFNFKKRIAKCSFCSFVSKSEVLGRVRLQPKPFDGRCRRGAQADTCDAIYLSIIYRAGIHHPSKQDRTPASGGKRKHESGSRST